MPIIEGTTGSPLMMQGVPGNGTNAVFTVSIGATVTGGTLGYFVWGGNRSTVAVAWNASNTTLVANAQAALNSIPGLTGGATVAAAGTMVAGVNGTMTVTFSGAAVAKTLVGALTLTGTALTGGSTASIAYSTSGVTAAFRNAGLGAIVSDTSTSGKLYQNNAGVVGIPAWTAQT